MSLIDNPVTNHKHARWIALAGYILGVVLIVSGYLIQADWSVYVRAAGLAVWLIPMLWSAKQWAKIGRSK